MARAGACVAAAQGVQRSDVAVPDERFVVRAQQADVDAIEQACAAVTTTQAEHGVDLRVGKSRMQVSQAAVIRPGEIRTAFEAAQVQARAQIEAREQRLDERQALGIHRASGRHDTHQRTSAQHAPGTQWRIRRPGRHGAGSSQRAIKRSIAAPSAGMRQVVAQCGFGAYRLPRLVTSATM